MERPRSRPISRPHSPTKSPFPSPRSNASAPSTLRTTSTASTPRAVSPARSARQRAPTSNLSPSARPHVRRPQTPNSLPSTPEPSRLRSLTTVSSHADSRPSPQPRSGKTTLDHALSPPVRITSKVSGLAKSILVNPSSNDSTLSPPQPQTRPTHARHRSPSISSTTSAATSPPPPSLHPIFYPITTATPAANPYRYAPPRPPPLPSSAHYANKSTLFGTTKIDPGTVPLAPPHSPPISSLSFSSRSSVSHSTISQPEGSSGLSDRKSSPERSPSAPGAGPQQNGTYSDHNSSSDSNDFDYGEDDDSEDHQVKAAAKSNRKIADLEITNRSLLAINASLESTKHKQAKEIRELRRKLRESRLILPPRAYRAFQSSQDHEDTADEEDEADEADEEVEEAADDVFARVKVMLEGLLESGHRALESSVTDFAGAGKGGTKVLSAEEVRSWRQDAINDDERGSDEDPHLKPSKDADSKVESNEGFRFGSPSAISPLAIPGNVEKPPSEATSLHHKHSTPGPPPPPILVTPSQ
ncbi:hypothetical protein AX17_000638 [Amanita inopinata Kibby_2008]|nr:hypothetical protein AX17_000638 [Amanita inopinata Kibby_2008]